MKIRKKSGQDDKIELQMTPMIDIVFQLLVFFIMTFKIVSQEGDFDIKMPEQGSGTPKQVDNEISNVRMTAYNAADAKKEGWRKGDLKSLNLDGFSPTIYYRTPTDAEQEKLDEEYADYGYRITSILDVEKTFGPIRKKLRELTYKDDDNESNDDNDREVNVYCAKTLRYEHVINAMTYISGYIVGQTGNEKGTGKIKKLIKTVNLQRLQTR